jgi:tetratricopeptide (TPR) repeat protein
MALQTAAIERRFVGAEGPEYALSLLERVMIAGRALWFYAAKLVLPIQLSFIYPRWDVDATLWWQWLFPAGAGAVVVSLWFARARLGRGPLVAILFFAGTLVPALGFIDVYPMRYSFVADHFQYVACIGLIVLGGGVVGAQLNVYRKRSPNLAPLLGGVLVAVLGLATWQRVWAYTDLETLWRTTLRTNPDSSMIHNNLGNLLLARGRQEEALDHLRKAAELEPDNIEARNSLGFTLMRQGRVDEALVEYRAALAARPGVALTHYNIGAALVAKREIEAAIAAFERAIEIAPDYADAHHDLGNVLSEQQRSAAAVSHLQAAIARQPTNPNFHNSLGTALVRANRVEEGIAHFEEAVRLRPDFIEAYNNMRYAAWLLATAPEPSRRNGAKALEIAVRLDEITAQNNPLVAQTLAAAHAENGHFEQAVVAAQRAIDLAHSQNVPGIARNALAEMAEYRDQRPHREALPLGQR